MTTISSIVAMLLMANDRILQLRTILSWLSLPQGTSTTVKGALLKGASPSKGGREGIDEPGEGSSCNRSTSFRWIPTYRWYGENDMPKNKSSTATCRTILGAFSSGRAVIRLPPAECWG
jgi:hypothetical protein